MESLDKPPAYSNVVPQQSGTNIYLIPEQANHNTAYYFQQVPQPRTQPVILITAGTCPYCRIGSERETFSLIGLIFGILFFPLGLLCCLLMTDTVCSNCGRYI